MDGEKNLDVLLRNMEPVLREGEYVFCTVDAEQVESLTVPSACRFDEDEGVTLVVLKQDASEAGLEGVYPSRMITLNVYSSLEAVGFLAKVSGILAAEGISVNAFSAFYHDHIFVPADRAEEAMALLHGLARAAA